MTDFIEPVILDDEPQMIAYGDLPAWAGPGNNMQSFVGNFDGEKFFGGLGAVNLQMIDYWSLRAWSSQLFNENPYARGIIRRLVTNEINTGLHPEPSPDESIIGVADESLNDWAEDVENRFTLWAKTPWLCDWAEQDSFGAIQRAARMEALISGDVLVVMRQSVATGLPAVQLIPGSLVQTPIGDISDNNITHGVERDDRGRHVAYWIAQEDGTYKRLPAWGEKSGRKLAWLVYGTEKRLDDVRGQPLLALIIQSLKELDRYRDSVQRKAVINSILAMFIKKTQDKPGSLPFQAGAARKATATTTDGDGSTRQLGITRHVPGVVAQELQVGEEPVGFGSQGIDLAFGPFEEVIVQTMAWANEIPPEILRLAFSNNYSASQAAINEFKIYLNKVREDFGEKFCHPVYVEWLISEVLANKITATNLIASWRDLRRHDEFTAWTSCEWAGAIKPSTDIKKQAQGYELLEAKAWITNDRASRELTGTNWSKNVRRKKREMEMLVEALRPLAEFQKEFGIDVSKLDPNQIGALTDALVEAVGGDQ